MSFLWPELLWLLALVPLLVLAYRWLLRRRAAEAVRFGSLGLVRQAIGEGGKWRRHVPPVLLLLALIAAIVSLARPSAVMSLPSLNKTIILALDASGSMRAKDVAPDRNTVAQTAAREFITNLPATTQVGIVSFAATAAVAQAPTLERDDLLAAIERIKLQRGTATGSAILISLQLLFPDIEFNLQTDNPRRDAKAASAKGSDGKADAKPDTKATPPGADGRPAAAKPPFKPVEPGSFGSAAIILVTDGQRNFGPDAIESARMAAERGVRVYTVAIGTPAGEVLSSEGWSMRVKLDEESLRQIADITRGKYFAATSAGELRAAYDAMNSRIVFERREMEVTALLAGASALLMLLAGALSVFWFGRLL